MTASKKLKQQFANYRKFVANHNLDLSGYDASGIERTKDVGEAMGFILMCGYVELYKNLNGNIESLVELCDQMADKDLGQSANHKVIYENYLRDILNGTENTIGILRAWNWFSENRKLWLN